MRKGLFTIVALILAAICAAPVPAQTANTPFTAPWYFASSFQLWSINGQSPNTYIFQGRNLCNSAGQNVNFFVFNASNTPVLIADANTANSEVVTPSAVVNTAGSCGATVAPAHNHYNFQLRSGTAGLQEAINTLSGQGAFATQIVLDKNWWTIANQMPGTYATAILAAAKGDASVYLVDYTTADETIYVWSGTAYSSTNALWSNTAPTITKGAALGGGSSTATIKTGSTALSGTVTLVTNSGSTATGTMFTMTYPAVSAGGPQYHMTCTMNSVTYPTTYTQTWSDSGSSTTYVAVDTIAATTTAPVASQTYVFTYNCK